MKLSTPSLRDRPDALFVGPGPFFNGRRVQLAQLAARHALPAIYAQREHVEVGGLISYGANNADAWQQVGLYVGRILKGAKPADLPVVQSYKVRTGHQRRDRQDARPQRAAVSARHRRRGDRMNRREFIALLGGAAVAWPVAGRAQQPAMPVIGFLGGASPDAFADRLRAFRSGLKGTGFVEGENVAIVYRWAENQIDRLPALAAELVRRQVALLVATGEPSALAAKASTTTIPVVIAVGEDPVGLGLVASLARPSGNITGVNFLIGELGAKQLGLVRELIPGATRMAVLVNPASPIVVQFTRDVGEAARAMGLQIQVVNAGTSGEITAAFATLVSNRVEALLVSSDLLFFTRRLQLATLATRHAIPAIYIVREYVEAGGLMSYGTSLTDAFRQVGFYAGRILKGARPADLPVVQSTKFELVINLVTAGALGLIVPPALLARADEVIE